MAELYSVLTKCPLFESINETEFNHLLSCINSYTKNYTMGEYVFFTGDKVHSIGILISGSVELIKEDITGSRHIVNILAPADIFGEGIACTKEGISPITVFSRQDSTILFIPFDPLIKTCSKSCGYHFQIIKNMMFLLGEKNYFMNRKMDLLLLKGLREKLATFLLIESSKHKSHTFNIDLSRNEMAEYLNVSRTSMCRELANMKAFGVIDYYKNSFKIISIELLKESIQKKEN